MRRRSQVLGCGAILLWTVLPLLSVLVAGTIANAAGCALDEGSVHPCVVFGRDIGESLYTMGVMGWFFFLTIPTGLVALVVFGIIVLIQSRKRAAVD